MNRAERTSNVTGVPGWVWDLACVALVLLLRVVLLLATRDDPVFRVPYLDGAFYHTWARSLAAGQGDFEGPYFLGPLYPYFLAIPYHFTTPDPWIVRIVQMVLGVLGAWMVLGIGRRLFGSLAARAAVLLFGLYGPLAFYENLLVMESLLLGLGLGSLWLVVVPRGHAKARGVGAGLLLGLATLGRPTMLLALPCLMLALARGGRAPAAVLACFAAWLVVVAPVTVRNARLGGGLQVATNGGVNFYAGNNARANGRFHEPEGVRFFRDPIFTSGKADALPSAVAARALTVRAVAGTPEAADSRAWLRRAWAWMREHPHAAIELWLRKAWLVLQAREVAQIESYSFHAERIAALRLFVVDFGWLWPLACLGIWQAVRRRAPDWRFVATFGLLMLAPCILFFVTSRYRLAVVPEAAIFAGGGAAYLVERLRKRDIRAAVFALLAVAPIAVLARLGGAPPRGAAGWESAQMAERLYALGDLNGAIQFQERAVAELPQRFEPALNLALYWSERGQAGDLERATADVEDLARRWPREPVVLFNLGVLLEQGGRIGAARQAWSAALAVDPGFEPARSRLLTAPPRGAEGPPTK